MRNKLRRDIIEAQTHIEDFDVLVITESWLTSQYQDNHVQFSNYNIAARAERNQINGERAPGGGVIIYVKKGINFHAPTSVNIEEYAQIASVKIKDLRIIGVYRMPAKNVTIDTSVKTYIQTQFPDQNVVFTGDFNLPGVDWINHTVTNRSEQVWLNMSKEMSLIQHVTGATQKYGNCLDLIFSRSSHSLNVDNIVIDPQLITMTDHYCVHFHVNTVFCKEVKKRTVLDIKNADWDCYKNKMKESHLIPRTERTEGVVGKWDLIENSILLAREVSCEKKEIVQGKAPRWISYGLQKSLKKDQKLRRLSKEHARSSIKRQRFKKWQYHHQWLKHQLRNSRVKYESAKILNYEKDSKSLFRDMKAARATSMSSPPISDLNGQPLTSDEAKANALQDKFLSVFTPNVGNVMTWHPIPGGLNNVQFTVAKIKRSIQSLKPNSAAGSDGIGPLFYKNSDLSLAFALSELFQEAFDTCHLPPKFLISKVIAIWKQKGKVSDIQMYRAITLMCIAFKIMEKIIVWEIEAYLDVNNLHDPWQHGFQKKKSTVTNLVDTWEFISKKLDNRENWITLSVDLSSAFDSLSIYHLMRALEEKGIGGNLGRFLEYWLTNRKQYVQVGDGKSRIEACSSGVPQGSCGGPSYFSILISSVYKNLLIDGAQIDLKFWAFADDTRLAFKAESAEKFIAAQEFITKFAKGLADVGLKLNPSKSVMVFYGNQKLKRNLSVDGVNIPIEKNSLELGCVFSNNLSFKPSIERNVSKATAFIFTVRNTLKVRNYSVLKKLYQVYFIPILLYGNQVWHTHHAYVRDELLAIYRKFWRLGQGKVNPGPEIMDPFQLSVKGCMMFMFKIRQKKTCLNPDDYYEPSHRTITRHYNPLDLKIKKNRLVSRDGFFTSLSATWFNQLPDNLKNEESETRFKIGITEYMKINHATPTYDLRPWHKRVAQQ